MGIFQELADKYNETPVLLNGMAVCKMHMGQFDEADNYLLKALAANSSDEQTLQNLVICAQHTRKAPEVVNRYLMAGGGGVLMAWVAWSRRGHLLGQTHGNLFQ